MKTTLNLSIPSRCGQKWETFSPTSNGGFCDSCNEIVIDFTKMNDDQILDFFKDRPAHVCGRLRADQMKTYTQNVLPKINPGYTLLRAGLLSLLLLFISKPSAAQKRDRKSHTEIVPSTNDSVSAVATSTPDRYFTGLVRASDDRSAIPGVNVLLKGTTFGTSTDSEGRFQFPVLLKEGDLLIFSFIGYRTIELGINERNRNGLEVPLELCMDVDIMGEVSVNTIYTEDRGVFQRWMKKVKALF